MAHAAEELSRFQDGETRLVYARRRDNPGETEFMPEGTAREVRERTKRELMCILDGCLSPDLTTVSRSKARDGFSHLSGGGHASLGMGIQRLQAQHASLSVTAWQDRHDTIHGVVILQRT
ncbi:hypothetical protein ACSHWG_12460 [Leucobacter sp. Z1108]|uniref:hypothetical protein n=1 Tax=Leucobacter sp. Z1108 TaxID=3439066 RepID=UPI003F2E149E